MVCLVPVEGVWCCFLGESLGNRLLLVSVGVVVGMALSTMVVLFGYGVTLVHWTLGTWKEDLPSVYYNIYYDIYSRFN
jgi:hypothetical protein